MTGTIRAVCQAAALTLLLAVVTAAPAKAQFGGGGDDVMTQFAPMLEMMKAKMGKKRFTTLMQTAGPMMSKMTEDGGGGLGGMLGGGGMGSGFGGGDLGFGDGGNVMGMLGSSEMVGMLPQMMSMIPTGGAKSGRSSKKARR